MKHRVLSFVLVLMLCLSLLPVGALAAEEDLAALLDAAEAAAEELETAEVTVEEEAETLLSGGIAIDETNFPDDTFRSYVAWYDTNGDEYLSEEEIASATSFNHTWCGIYDLTGIEYLTELTSLNVEGCKLTSLDLSANTKLESLTCTSNSLTSLNVSNCTALQEIKCSINNLTSLDVSANTELRTLLCASNELKELELRNNTALMQLGCNYNQLTSLDVSANTELYSMSCIGNSLTSLNIAGIDWLLRAYKGSKYDMGDGSMEYSYWDYSEDVYATLTVDADVTIYTEAGAGGDSGSAAEDVAVDEMNFPDAIFREYVSDNFDTDGNELLSEEEIAAATEIKVPEMGIASLAGVEYFTNLRQLQCQYNEITKLDLSSNTLLYSLYCGRNKLTELNVSNTRLSYLETSNNQLTELDLSGLEYLDTLYCTNNNLTTLDVSGNAKLQRLGCDENQLKTLDVSKNAALENLYCANNDLTSLDVSANTELTQLGCWGNGLTTLDVSKNTKLEGLQCGENKLTSLDVSGLTALEMVRCESNQLTSLKVTGCTALDDLICSGNQLTTLDVSDNTALLVLECAGNMIERLDICNNPALLYVLNCGVEPEQYSSVNGTGGFYDWLYYFCEYEDDYVSLGVDPLMVIVTPDGEIVTPEIVTGGDEGGDDSGESGDEYSDDVKAAYVEYIAAFLTEQGTEEEVVAELIYVAEAGDYDVLADVMIYLYEEGTITELPMTVEEFAAWYNAISGDADGDGTVDVIDLVVLMKSILKMDGAEVSLKAGDLNEDGKVDILDVIRLVRELAKNAEGGTAATG